MNRFDRKQKKGSIWRSVIFPVVCFVLLLLFFFKGMDTLGSASDAEQKKSLERALLRSAVTCYATEGFYPPGVDYLQEHYGIRYDSAKYIIDYQIEGANMMPTITVIEK